MSTRDKLCLLAIAMLLLVGAPLSFGLFDPLLTHKSRSESGDFNAPLPNASCNTLAEPIATEPEPMEASSDNPIKAGRAPIKVAVVNAATMQPIAARLEVREFLGNRAEVVDQRSAPDGRFLLLNCNANRAHKLTIAGEGCVERTVVRPAAPGGQVDDCGTITVEPLFAVRLRVLGELGQHVKIRGLRIRPTDSPDYLLPWQFEVQASLGGVSELRLPRGLWTARILAEGLAVADNSFTVRSEGQTFDLAVAPAGEGSARVRVEDWTGNRAEEFTLELTRLGPGDPVGLLCRTRRSQDVGAVSFNGLPEGRYELTLSVWASFYGNHCAVDDELKSSMRFGMGRGQEEDLTIAAPRSCKVMVRVLAFGKPIPGTNVWLCNGAIYAESGKGTGGLWPDATCDESGVATFENVAPGCFGVDISLPGDAVKCIGERPERFPGDRVPWEYDTYSQTSKTIDIELFDPACAILVGVVRGADGGFVNCYRLLDGATGEEVCEWASGRAGFTLGSVPLGRYILEAKCGGNNVKSVSLELTRTGYTFVEIDAAPHTLICVSELAPGDEGRDLAHVRVRLIPEAYVSAPPATAFEWVNKEVRIDNVASGTYFIEAEFLSIREHPLGWCHRRIEIGGERELRVSLKVDRTPPAKSGRQFTVNPSFSAIDQVRDLYGDARFLNAEGFIVGRSRFWWESDKPERQIHIDVSSAPYASVVIDDGGSCLIVLKADDPRFREGSFDLEFVSRREALVLALEADDLSMSEVGAAALECRDSFGGFSPCEGLRPVLWQGKVSLWVARFWANGQTLRLRMPGFEAFKFKAPERGSMPSVVPARLKREH